LMEYVKYEYAYMFFYSERPKTLAERKYEDDVPLDVKKRRLTEVVDLQRKHSLERNQNYLGKTYRVLIEKVSKKSDEELSGRNSQNALIVFPRGEHKIGTYINVKVIDCNSATLKGEVVND